MTYHLYSPNGTHRTVTEHTSFFLPNPADGFDQNQYASNYEFGRSLNGHWPPAGCVPGPPIGSSTGPPAESPVDTGAAPPVGTEAANLAAPAKTGAPGQTVVVRYALDDTSEAQAPLKLSDFGGDWTISVNASLSFIGGQTVADELQSSPAVRADGLEPVQRRAGRST